MAAPIDPALKARALELYVTEGPAAAAKQTGLKPGTIRYWASKAGLFTQRREHGTHVIAAKQLTAAEQRTELAMRCYADAGRLLDQLFTPAELVKIVTLAQGGEQGGSVAEVVRARLKEPTAGEKRHLAVAAAVLLDKAQLLSGEATARFGAGGMDWEKELEAFAQGAAAASEAMTEPAAGT